MKLALRPRAVRDLEDIFNYSADLWGTQRAVLYLRGLQAGMERLLQFPELGRVIDDVKPGARLLPAQSHLILYRIGSGKIDVIRILHRRMDVGRHV